MTEKLDEKGLEAACRARCWADEMAMSADGHCRVCDCKTGCEREVGEQDLATMGAALRDAGDYEIRRAGPAPEETEPLF